MGGDQSPKPINPAMDNQENKCKGRPPRPLYSAEPYLKSNAYFKSRPASCYPFPATSPPALPLCRRPPSFHSPRSRDFDRRPLGTSKGCGDWLGGKSLETESGKRTQSLTNRRCSKVLFLFLNTDGFFAFSC